MTRRTALGGLIATAITPAAPALADTGPPKPDPAKPFPDDFLFGVANSDSQTESYVPEYADIRDKWYEATHMTPRGKATDFWNRFQEDVNLAKGLGCKVFRFSVSWARVEPQPGQWNQAALDHYSDVVDAIRAAGMEPMVTLHHFVWPVHVEERGGMIAVDFPTTFANYATRVVNRMGDRVTYWITFNEPNVLLFGYIKVWWEKNYVQPPGLPAGAASGDQSRAQMLLMRNLFLSHTAARQVIRTHNPAAMVGANPSLLGLPPWLQTFINRNVIHLKSQKQLTDSNRNLVERQVGETGKVDVVIAMLTETLERESQVHFSDVYFLAHQRVLVTAASPIQSLQDLKDKKVAVVQATTADSGFVARLPTARAIRVEENADAMKKLDAGAVAAFFADDGSLVPLMLASPGRYRLVGGNLSEEPYAPAVTQGNPMLLDQVDQAVRGFISSGKWAESYRRNFGEPVPDPPRYPARGNLSGLNQKPLATTDVPKSEHLDRVQQRSSIRIGVRTDRPGMGFRDPATGQWTGMEIDLAKAVAVQILGDEKALELVPVQTAERISVLRSWARIFDPIRKWWALVTTSCCTSWWNLGMAGKLETFLCPTECVGQMDFVGLDYYWGLSTLSIGRIDKLVQALTKGRMEEAPVYPGALHLSLKEVSQWFPKLPIIIVENGCVEKAGRITHAEYLKLHLAQVQKAVSENINVKGYINWSITSNRELGFAFSPNTDFGLYHIELDKDPTLARTVTPAAGVYQTVIRTRSVSK